MYRIGEFVSMIDHALSTKKRRHIMGGVLMSVSLLFGGIAITILTAKDDDNVTEDYDEIYIE